MSLEVLKLIIMACQVTGTYGSVSVTGTYSNDKKVELTYEEVFDSQVGCQKKLLKCFDKQFAKPEIDEANAVGNCLKSR